MCGAEKQSQRVRAHGGAVGRWTSQWTTDFSRNSGTYIVYNSHVTCRNSSFSLTMVMHTSHFFAFHWVVCFPLATFPSPVLWAYASATVTEFNDAHCSGDFPISSTGCTSFQHNNCGHGDISAIIWLILSLSGYNHVNILWYTATVNMMTFRGSHWSYQSVNNIHRIYSRRSR